MPGKTTYKNYFHWCFLLKQLKVFLNFGYISLGQVILFKNDQFCLFTSSLYFFNSNAFYQKQILSWVSVFHLTVTKNRNGEEMVHSHWAIKDMGEKI